MMKNLLVLPVLIVLFSILVGCAQAAQGAVSPTDTPAPTEANDQIACKPAQGETTSIADAKLYVEYNSTDEDLGVHGYLGADGWSELCVYNPSGELMLAVKPQAQLKAVTMASIFFEGREPPLEEFSFEDLKSFPEGQYEVRALSYDGTSLVGEATFSRNVPAPPEIIAPELAEDEENAGDVVVPTDGMVVQWEDVTETTDGGPLTISGYEIIITKVEHDDPHGFSRPIFDVHVGPDQNSLSVPVEFLEPDTVYELEVLALEESGNQTITVGFFKTTKTPATGSNGDITPLKDAKLIIEHNATDEDTGFQGFVDSEGWERLVFTGPEGELLTIDGQGKLGNLGLTELFFETVEPPNADVSIAEMLTVLPAGNYTIEGAAIEAGENKGPTSGIAWLTHNIPAGPDLLSPEEEAVVPADDDLVVSWSPVTKTIDGAAVNLIAYQLIIERDGEPHPHMIGKQGLSMYLPASVTSITVPRGFLEPGAPYNWEVLAIEESGNQTLSSSSFSIQ